MPLSPGQRRLYSGDFSSMSKKWQADGSVILTLHGGTLPIGHRLHVRDLWGENEEVLSEEVLPPGPPPWIQNRLDEAGRG